MLEWHRRGYVTLIPALQTPPHQNFSMPLISTAYSIHSNFWNGANEQFRRRHPHYERWAAVEEAQDRGLRRMPAVNASAADAQVDGVFDALKGTYSYGLMVVAHLDVH